MKLIIKKSVCRLKKKNVKKKVNIKLEIMEVMNV